MARAPGTAFTLKGWHVLSMMLAFFGLVIAINVGFAIAAIGTFPGEDVRQSYLVGLRYNHTLAARRAQAALGWRADAALARAESGRALVRLRIVDSSGLPVEGLRLTGVLRRPAQAHADIAFAFHAAAQGRYEAVLAGVAAGAWDVEAQSTAAAQPFALTRRFVIGG